MDPIKRIRYHTFCGGRYRFRYVDPEEYLSKEELAEIRKASGLARNTTIVGATDDNAAARKEMIISDKLEAENPKDLLRVLLDEAYHAHDSSVSNDIVDTYARNLADFLWRCGYRRVNSFD